MTGNVKSRTASPPHHLRVEHLGEPLGLQMSAPRLSWRLPDGATEQRAYRLTADNGWDTDWVTSNDSVLLPYTGPELTSRQRIAWRVQVETDLGQSPLSEAGWFEMGLLHRPDWAASWIEPGLMPAGPKGQRAAALLRCEFVIERPFISARLRATALGLYEAFLDGQRVGDAELTPGFTQYNARVQLQTYDVAPLLSPGVGRHVLTVVLADGWFRGQVGLMRAADLWGDRVSFLGQLELMLSDGSIAVVGTGPQWTSSTGHVTAADLIAGERWDLRRFPRGWDQAGFDDRNWAPVQVVEGDFDLLANSDAPPVRRIEQITPRSVTRLANGAQIIDLGQNINGWIRLNTLGPEGTTVTLTHGEWLAPDGDLTVRNLQPDFPFLPQPLPAGQVDVVVSAGRAGETFEPRRTTHGFQYVRVEGHPDDLTIDDARGVVVHTDMPRIGWFSCSDDRINRLHQAAVWSFRDNACDIPTDCPHRERAGWTGDWQLYIPTAAFLFDVAGLSTKWLHDVVADQWPDGTVANFSPMARSEGRESPLAFLNGSAGWGDAAIIVPWELYRAYGDTRILRQLWPTMVRWLDRAERMARLQRHPDRVARRLEPAAHERYLWDTGFHWGEWLVPGDDMSADIEGFATIDKGDVATAYFARSAELMSRIATLIGEAEEAKRYLTLSAAVRAAWQAEYLDQSGHISPDNQANCVRALAFDLVPDHLRATVAEQLVNLVRQAGTHLGTGFLATPYLLPALVDHGHLDVAYDLLLSDTEPSWLVMIDRGATTVWEQWHGVDAQGVPHESLNHYSKGAVVSFLHRYTAGIDLVEPAYRRFRIHPRPGGGLRHTQAAHESPYGRIESAWDVDEDRRFTLRVVIPAGTEADVVLPDGTQRTVRTGEHHFTCPMR